MTEQNTQQQTNETTTEQQTTTRKRAKRGEIQFDIFTDLEVARQSKPEVPADSKTKLHLFSVTCPGKETRYLWGRDHGQAVLLVARADNYEATVAGKASKDKVASMLAQLSPEERQALLAQFAGSSNGQEAEPEKPTTRGKRGK